MNGLVAFALAVAVAWSCAEQVAPGITVHVLTAYEQVIVNAQLPAKLDAQIARLTP